MDETRPKNHRIRFDSQKMCTAKYAYAKWFRLNLEMILREQVWLVLFVFVCFCKTEKKCEIWFLRFEKKEEKEEKLDYCVSLYVAIHWIVECKIREKAQKLISKRAGKKATKNTYQNTDFTIEIMITRMHIPLQFRISIVVQSIWQKYTEKACNTRNVSVFFGCTWKCLSHWVCGGIIVI